MDKDLVWWKRNPWRVRGTHRAQASDSGRLGALLRVGRLRGPNSVGNLVTPGPLRRASGWQLYARNTQRVISPKKTSQISSGQSAGSWMSSLKRGSSPKLVDYY